MLGVEIFFAESEPKWLNRSNCMVKKKYLKKVSQTAKKCLTI